MKTNRIATLAAAVLTLFCATSCDDTTETVGSSLTNQVDQFTLLTDTFEVKTRSITVDSVLSRSMYSYLGHIMDPETQSYVTANYSTQRFGVHDVSQVAVHASGKD